MDTIKNGPRLRLVGAETGEGAGGVAAAVVATAPAATRTAAGAVHAAPTGAMPAAFWTRRIKEPAPRAHARLAAAAEVERENLAAAATMAATDPRWVLALRIYESIEGGRAAILRPHKRRNLVALATRLGLRPFDANLIIAIVQDAARCGEAPLGPEMTGRLTLVRTPGREAEPAGPRVSLRVLVGAMGVAAVLGYLILDMLIGWVAR